MDVHALTAAAIATLMAVAWKLIGAIVLWLVGRWLIRFAGRLLGRTLSRQHVDATLARYFQTGVGVVLNIALVVAILGFFGVETTSFAALLAAGGVAIGVAWGGLLVQLRRRGVPGVPAAVQGRRLRLRRRRHRHGGRDRPVRHDHQHARQRLTIVGNNKVFSDTIQNFSANPFRRVDLTVTINNAVDHHRAISLLKDRLKAIPNVLASPAPVVDVLQFTPAGPMLCVRPYCRTRTTGRCTSTRTGPSAKRSAKRDSRRPCPRTRSPAWRRRRSKPLRGPCIILVCQLGARSELCGPFERHATMSVLGQVPRSGSRQAVFGGVHQPFAWRAAPRAALSLQHERPRQLEWLCCSASLSLSRSAIRMP